jgi:hypothetical protein
LGYVSAVDSKGRTIWIADAHRGDGKRFVVHADEKLTALLELESVTRAASVQVSFFTKLGLAIQFAPQGSHAEQSQPSREIVEPPSGTEFTMGPASTGGTKENAITAAKTIKSLDIDTVLMSD